MSRFHSYLSSAGKVIASYKKGEPLSHHLKQFFASNKKYGSRDRKQIAALCYSYFRGVGLFSTSEFIDNIILNALFLCNSSSHQILENLKPELNDNIQVSFLEKLAYLKIDKKNVFKFSDELSSEIDADKFGLSFLKQPALFLRVRPGCMNKVTDSLTRNEMFFEIIAENSIKCLNTTNVNEFLKLNKEVVVQDLNSQQVFNFLKEYEWEESKRVLSVWDACAASGGKSILINDVLKGKVKLTASDIRQNILSNYTSRLEQAGINIYRKFVQDLTVSSGLSGLEKFDVIVCDVPCTGSGTWSRNPEQYFSFEKEMISTFVVKQKAIVKNVVPHLQKNGLLFYVTCSAFKSENDEMVEHIQTHHKLNCIQKTYLKGYNDEADTMFTAVFQL